MTTATEDQVLNNGVPNGTSKNNSKRKEKNKLKKKKKKQNKQQKKQDKITAEEIKKQDQTQDVEIEYVEVNPLEGMDENDPAFAEFSEIFEKFKEAAQAEALVYAPEEETAKQEAQVGTNENAEDLDDDETEKKSGVSNKLKKKQKRLSLAVLKQLVRRPDLVESWDATSADPILLVFLKGCKNTVPVPIHWSQKRKYLQGKRGVEKPPFQLPEFIENTGVANLRKGTSNANKSLKQKQREKMNAKVGRMEFDYQVLHDAFFKYQTKPKLTKFGDLYYEGKEFEITLREKRPGVLSEELKRALGMPEGAPPPWLFNMQRFGPPPAYPNLKIPGVNAPLPEGARYGYHPGGWGKPPVDEFNRPLYGDVFGTAPEPPPEITQPIERRHWGEVEVEEEEAMEQQEEQVPQEEEEPHPSGFETPSGLETPSGMETPETIELRKAPPPPPSRKPAEPEDESDKQLYHVIQEQEVTVGSGTMYGSSHRYVVPSGSKGASNKVDLMKSQATEKLDLSLNPSEVENMEELSEELLAKKYEAARQEKKDSERKEDMSDLVKEQLKKRKKKESSDDKKAKKYKEFKF